jgi:hypothetical protein
MASVSRVDVREAKTAAFGDAVGVDEFGDAIDEVVSGHGQAPDVLRRSLGELVETGTGAACDG